MNANDSTYFIPTENIGHIDKIVRIGVAFVFIFYILLGIVTVPMDISLLSIASIYLVITAIISLDPVYIPLQLTSRHTFNA